MNDKKISPDVHQFCYHCGDKFTAIIFGGPNWVKMVISLSATPAAVLLTKGYAQENLLK
jgi:hypothetical protein